MKPRRRSLAAAAVCCCGLLHASPQPPPDRKALLRALLEQPPAASSPSAAADRKALLRALFEPPTQPSAILPPGSSYSRSKFDGGYGAIDKSLDALRPDRVGPASESRRSKFGRAVLREVAIIQEVLSTPLGNLLRNMVMLSFGFHLLGKLVKDTEGPDTPNREGLAARCDGTGLPPEIVPRLNHHELSVAADLVDVKAMDVGFDDIAGMEDIKAAVQELVTDPWDFPELYENRLLRRPTGILLYGPPGCGKTMLAKAIAAYSGARFISVGPSTLLRKFFGESNQMVRALFSLARKIQPCVIFIDEVDGILYRRGDTDQQHNRDVSTEFMQLWDGLQAGQEKVLVLAATNRPWDLDPAAQRRFGRSFLVGLPGPVQRQQVLRKSLKDVPLERTFDFEAVAAATESYSCSDLVDLCREAVQAPLRDAKARLRRQATAAAAGAGDGDGGGGGVLSKSVGARAALRPAGSAAVRVAAVGSGDGTGSGAGRMAAGGMEEAAAMMGTGTATGPGGVHLRPLRTADVFEAQQRVVPSFVQAEEYRASLEAHRNGLVEQIRNNYPWQ